MHPSHSTIFLFFHRSIRLSVYFPGPLLLFNPCIFLSSSLLASQQGIGRLILKEEMKARSGIHDNDQWGSRRSSRCSSKEALNNLGGYGSLNGCKREVEVFFFLIEAVSRVCFLLIGCFTSLCLAVSWPVHVLLMRQNWLVVIAHWNLGACHDNGMYQSEHNCTLSSNNLIIDPMFQPHRVYLKLSYNTSVRCSLILYIHSSHSWY